MQSYLRQIRQTASDETQTVWNVHRFWFSVAGLAATVLLGALNGFTVITFRAIAINGLSGFGITFLGSYLINLLRSPLLLDRISKKRIDELEAERPYVVSTPYPKNLGNAALRKEGLEIAAGIKDLYLREADYESEWMHGRTLDRDATAEERNRQFRESIRSRDKNRLTVQAVDWKEYQTKAVLLRDEMRERLGGIAPKKKYGHFDTQYEVGQAGGFTVQDIASELEWLATQIPANRLLQ